MDLYLYRLDSGKNSLYRSYFSPLNFQPTLDSKAWTSKLIPVNPFYIEIVSSAVLRVNRKPMDSSVFPEYTRTGN